MSTRNKKTLQLKSYSFLNYLLLGSIGVWFIIRLAILFSPRGDQTGLFTGGDTIYLFNNIPLSWLHGFYLYELNIGALRIIVGTAFLIVVLNLIIKRQYSEFSMNSIQKFAYKLAILVLIIAFLSLIAFIIFHFLTISGLRDWQF